MHVTYPATTFNVTLTYPNATYPWPRYTTGTTQQQLDGNAFYTSKVLVARPDWSNGAGRPGIIALHGGGINAYDSFNGDPNSSWGDYTRFLADSGFVIVAPDHGYVSFSNNLALSCIDQAYTYLTGITGGTKVGIMGSSGGANAVLQWARRNPTKVTGALTIGTYLDIDSARGTGGWTVPYSITPSDPNYGLPYIQPGDATFVSNINDAFLCSTDASYTANVILQGHASARNPEMWRGINVQLVQSLYDASVPYQQTLWWYNQVNHPSVRLRMVTGPTTGHAPRLMLAGGANDVATAAAGGYTRAEMRDYFLEVAG